MTISKHLIEILLIMTLPASVNRLGAQTSMAQQAYLKASNSGPRDDFGGAVALSGDTLVVGALSEDSGAMGVNGNQSDNGTASAGAAYVFVRTGSTWIQQAYLKPSNTGAGDNFGWSVAVSGDTVVVGAIFEDSNAIGVNGDPTDNSGTNSGAAYVFVRVGGNWIQQAYLKASNTEPNDNFGWSVAVSGDTVVVSARGEDSSAIGVNGNQTDNSALSSGAAYVFVRRGTNWIQQAYLKASNTDFNDQFGRIVSVALDTLVVAATFEDSSSIGVNGDQNDNSATNSGAAYVFVRNGTNWIQQAYLKASNTDLDDYFGFAAAIFGETVVIGAVNEDSKTAGVNGIQSDNSNADSGAAYVFVRHGTNWNQEAYLKASNSETNDAFGFSVALSGDTIILGAYQEDSIVSGVNILPAQFDNSAYQAGAAYVFVRNGANWSQQAYLKASNTDPNGLDNFGWSVGISGDTAVVGAPGEDSNATGVNGNQHNNTPLNFGAAYAFTGLGLGPRLTIERSGGASRISWPFPAKGFVLEECNALTEILPTDWTQVPFPFQTNASHIFISLPPATDDRYYRLRAP